MTWIPDSLLEDIGRNPDQPKDDPPTLHDPVTGQPWAAKKDSEGGGGRAEDNNDNDTTTTTTP